MIVGFGWWEAVRLGGKRGAALAIEGNNQIGVSRFSDYKNLDI